MESSPAAPDLPGAPDRGFTIVTTVCGIVIAVVSLIATVLQLDSARLSILEAVLELVVGASPALMVIPGLRRWRGWGPLFGVVVSVTFLVHAAFTLTANGQPGTSAVGPTQGAGRRTPDPVTSATTAATQCPSPVQLEIGTPIWIDIKNCAITMSTKQTTLIDFQVSDGQLAPRNGTVIGREGRAGCGPTDPLSDGQRAVKDGPFCGRLRDERRFRIAFQETETHFYITSVTYLG